ncbi:MAG: Gx transporter family protein [Spirochaetaceae bacterium]|nr:Gx transporter family protein [Spirochaetaceae bacterium]
MKKLMHSLTENKETLPLLAACCIFLSMIEYIIPKPIIFMRYGIANIPIMISLKIFSPGMTMILVLLKIIGQGIITGTIFSYIFLFSFSGSLASGLAMIFIYKIFKDKITMVGVSVAGAFASNIIQLIVAKYFIFGKAAIIMGPPIILIGTVTSVFVGIFAELFILKSQWLKTKLLNNKGQHV